MKPPKTLKVGFLGFGTVGTGVYRMLQDNSRAVTDRIGFPVEVVKIGVRDLKKERGVGSSFLTSDLNSIVSNPEIDVILELMGGVSPAAELVEAALNAKKSVVTANKELMAKDGSRLVHLAKSHQLDLHFEAAVGGGIPLVQPLKHQLSGNDVLKLMGILNGTCNYILTRMDREGSELEPVLKDAQALGFAEAEPSNDVDGFDTVYKLAVLTAIAFGKLPDVAAIYREGIRDLKADEFKYAELFGYKIKLLGIVEPVEGGKVLARVHPTLVPKSHSVANVNGVYNSVWLRGDFVGDIMFSGRGAGGDPTASAVVGDLIDVGRNMAAQGPGSAIPFGVGLATAPISELVTEYYLRIRVHDQPMVLGEIAMACGKHNVSLSAMEMKVLNAKENIGEIAFLTHQCQEKNFQLALQDLRNLSSVRSVEAFLRVETEEK